MLLPSFCSFHSFTEHAPALTIQCAWSSKAIGSTRVQAQLATAGNDPAASLLRKCRFEAGFDVSTPTVFRGWQATLRRFSRALWFRGEGPATPKLESWDGMGTTESVESSQHRAVKVPNRLTIVKRATLPICHTHHIFKASGSDHAHTHTHTHHRTPITHRPHSRAFDSGSSCSRSTTKAHIISITTVCNEGDQRWQKLRWPSSAVEEAFPRHCPPFSRVERRSMIWSMIRTPNRKETTFRIFR